MGRESKPKNIMEKLAGVRFHEIGRIYHFDATDYPELREGDFVIVETTRGRQISQVITLDSLENVDAPEAIKPIERIATGRDMALRQHWRNKEPEALTTCREIARRLNLPVKIIKAEYSCDGARLLFLYAAEDRVDTRELKRQVNRSFRARVDLKLIGPRDVAKTLGGYGACGGLRCCNLFLTEFRSISIRMAKEQSVSLNPQEITGMCGRLRCCLQYEYEQYVEARKKLPKRGTEIGTHHGRGTVVELLSLKEAVIAQVGNLQIEVPREEIIALEEHEAPAQPTGQPGEKARKQPKKETETTRAEDSSTQPSTADADRRKRSSRRRRKKKRRRRKTDGKSTSERK